MIEQLVSELSQDVDKKLNFIKLEKDNLVFKDKIVFF